MSVHQGQPVLATGAPLASAKAAMIMIHGRGASAQDILGLSQEFAAANVAYLAPQANDNTWYPYRFIEPIEKNEPYLTSALTAVGDLVRHVQQAGVPTEKIMLLGFSQGACLTLEFAARNPQAYGGVFGLSGGLIGATVTVQQYSGSLAGAPVFLGCSDVDFHIPVERVHESTTILQQLGATVTERIYPNMGHTINMDEVNFIREIIAQVAN